MGIFDFFKKKKVVKEDIVSKPETPKTPKQKINLKYIEVSEDNLAYYNGKPFTGTGFSTDSNGVISIECKFLMGLKHGITKTYYNNGKLDQVLNYVNDELN